MSEDNKWLDELFTKYHAANNLLNANEKNYSDDELLQAFLDVESKLKAAILAHLDQVVREAVTKELDYCYTHPALTDSDANTTEVMQGIALTVQQRLREYQLNQEEK